MVLNRSTKAGTGAGRYKDPLLDMVLNRSTKAGTETGRYKDPLSDMVPDCSTKAGTGAGRYKHVAGFDAWRSCSEATSRPCSWRAAMPSAAAKAPDKVVIHGMSYLRAVCRINASSS